MKQIAREEGYTLIEVMTALVLLFIVLLPSSYVISYLLTNDNGRNQIAAANLAEEMMEKTLHTAHFTAAGRSTQVNGQQYHVHRSVTEAGQMLRIDVRVYHNDEKIPILEIYRYVVVRGAVP